MRTNVYVTDYPTSVTAEPTPHRSFVRIVARFQGSAPKEIGYTVMALVYTPEDTCTFNSAADTTYEQFLDILAGLTLTQVSLTIDIDRKRVRRNCEDIELTTQEFALLAHLALNADHAVSRDELFSTVWAHRDLDAQSRTVDAHIRRLRVKLHDPDLISTVRGAGYRLNTSPTVAIIATQARARRIALAA